MSVVDVERVLAPIAGEDPTGENLAGDFAYFNLLEMAKGTPERAIGDVVQPATEPDWREVLNGAMPLLDRSKDLWLAALVALAGLRIDGIEGLRDGLVGIRGLLEQHWDGVYPRVDPDDQDPSERLSALSALSAPAGAYGDDWRFVERIRLAPLTDSRQIGRFSLRDISLASGETTPRADEEPPNADLIEAAFEDTPSEALQELSARVGEALEALDGIRSALAQGLEADRVPDFDSVRTSLQEAQRTLADRLSRRGYAAEGPALEEAPAGQPAAGSPSGEIRSPQDVKRELDRIISYYAQHEPSSPVPLLLRRAQRLVSRSFMDIIRDLTPDAVENIQQISGERDEDAD